MKQESGAKLPSYGGQALIEGVLMRGRNYVVGSFRAPNGEIAQETEQLTGIYKSKLAKIPFLRGLIVLWDSLSLGMKFLTISANIQAENEEEEIGGSALFFTVLFSLALSIGLFFVLPTLITGFFAKIFGFSTFCPRLSVLVFCVAIMLTTDGITFS